MYGLLIAVASLIAEPGLYSLRALVVQYVGSVVGVHRQLPLNIRDLPRPGIEPICPALAGRFLTTGLPGKSSTVSS